MNKKNKSIEFVKFFKKYILTLSNVIDKINLDKLYEAANLISNTIKKKKFYLCLWQWWFSSYRKSLYMRLFQRII